MEDLLLISFNAQCKWMEPRILEKDKQLDFIRTKTMILVRSEYLNTISSSPGNQLALDIYLETKKNLEARFETGISLESSYYDYLG